MTRLSLIAASFVAAAGAVAASTGPAVAADSGTVAATVTAASPCIAIETASVDFGIRPFHSGLFGAPGHPGSPAIVVQNCGATGELVHARGTDATGTGATWSLIGPASTCPSPNRYGLFLWNGPLAVAGAASTALETTNKQLPNAAGEVAAWPAGETQNQLGQIYMPCVGSDGAGQAMAMQIIYTATF